MSKNDELALQRDAERFGAVLLVFSVLIFGLHSIGVYQAFTLAALYNTPADQGIRDAVKYFGVILIPSLVGRVVSSLFWMYGRYKGTPYHELYYGKLVLLIVSSVSTYAGAISIGALTKNVSVIDEYQNIDINLPNLVRLAIITFIISVIELVYSHVRKSAGVAKGNYGPPTQITYQQLPNALVIVAFVSILFVGLIVLSVMEFITGGVLSGAKVSTALNPNTTREANKLIQALKTAREISLVKMACAAFTLFVYAAKGYLKKIDERFSGKMLLLCATAAYWIVSTVQYGTVLPNVSILAVYELKAAELVVVSNSSSTITSFIKLVTASFWLQYVCIFVIHVIAFLRSRGIPEVPSV